jgi:excisionase family DNA binding protein
VREPNDRRPYTVEALAERWQCGKDAIYALIRKFAEGEPGGLPAFTIGGKLWRIKAEVVDQWEDNGGSTRSENSDSVLSMEKLSPSGEDPASDIALESSRKQRADLRLMRLSAAQRL